MFPISDINNTDILSNLNQQKAKQLVQQQFIH